METKTTLESHREFLMQSRIPLRLACITRQGWPMVLSVWFLYEAGGIFCATQKSSKLITHLEDNPRCAFEVAGDQPPYKGIRGQGSAMLIKERGHETLERLLNRYQIGSDAPLRKNLLSRSGNEIAIEIKPFRVFAWDYTSRMKDEE